VFRLEGLRLYFAGFGCVDACAGKRQVVFQSARLAYVAPQVDDQKLEELLACADGEKILENWLTAAEFFESNAERLTCIPERSVALRGRRG
jgi:hypothetical protein